jgi:hypothetical protein
VQLFVLLLQNFEKVAQMIELFRFGGAPNGYPFAPLPTTPIATQDDGLLQQVVFTSCNLDSGNHVQSVYLLMQSSCNNRPKLLPL